MSETEWDQVRAIVIHMCQIANDNGLSSARAKLDACLPELRKLCKVNADWPTPDAYNAACQALTYWRDEAERLAKLAGVEPRQMHRNIGS